MPRAHELLESGAVDRRVRGDRTGRHSLTLENPSAGRRRDRLQNRGRAVRHHFRHHSRSEHLDNTESQCSRTGSYLRFSFGWWRGQDLNLRPSGYEPVQCRTSWSRLPPCSTAHEAIRATFVTSTPVLSAPVPKNTAPFTARPVLQERRVTSPHRPRRVTSGDRRSETAWVSTRHQTSATVQGAKPERYSEGDCPIRSRNADWKAESDE